jgi:hypothetical protein
VTPPRFVPFADLDPDSESRLRRRVARELVAGVGLDGSVESMIADAVEILAAEDVVRVTVGHLGTIEGSWDGSIEDLEEWLDGDVIPNACDRYKEYRHRFGEAPWDEPVVDARGSSQQ